MELRGIFDEDPHLYDRARPGYPAALFDELTASAGLGPGCRVLEIAPGTGKATVDLARRGATITAVELGPHMAAVAARAVPTATIVVAAFEEWPLPAQPFDLVFVATAYHWLDPAVRVVKAARALRPGGVLAVVETHHIRGADDAFIDMQACYQRWDPETPSDFRLPTAAQVPQRADTDGTGLFAPAKFHQYIWDQDYSARSYVELLQTYSNHRSMPPAQLDGLLGCVADLIRRRPGAAVTKTYLTQLWTARRTATNAS